MSNILSKIYNRVFTYWQYAKEVQKLGLTFDEYCTFVFQRHSANNSIAKSKLFGKEILRTNTFWYVHSVLELFNDEVYKFESANQHPVIIDCGTNIGLSLIYFKKLFPFSKILGFEADPNLFNVCQKNLDTFKLSDIQLVNAAVWDKEGVVKFKLDNSLGGKISDNTSGENLIEIKTVKLSHYLGKKIDFLKIDIEGAEYEVLKECQDHLNNVERLFVEYHSNLHSEQLLDELLEIFKKAGFRYYIEEASDVMRYPFTEHTSLQNGFDLQLNISCYRPLF